MRSESFPWEADDQVVCVANTPTGAGRYPVIGKRYTIKGTDYYSKRVSVKFGSVSWWFEATDFAPADTSDDVIANYVLSSKEEPVFTHVGLSSPANLGWLLAAIPDDAEVNVLLETSDNVLLETSDDDDEATAYHGVFVHEVSEEDQTVGLRWAFDSHGDEKIVLRFDQIKGVWV